MPDYTMMQFIDDAQRTKSDHITGLKCEPSAQGFNPKGVDMLHAVIGISTEGGELLDAFKKSIFYGKPLDVVNLDEEMGDVLWYIAIYAKARGTTFEALAERIVKKLQARYPEKFTSEHALNRNLEVERKILET